MSFSERFGYAEPKVDLSPKDLPNSLLNGLWDVLRLNLFSQIADYDFMGQIQGFAPKFKDRCVRIWFDFYRESIDEIPPFPDQARDKIRGRFMDRPFPYCYDFLEFAVSLSPERWRGDLERDLNAVLERERAAFRFIDGLLIQITDDSVLREIEAALTQSGSEGVREHLRRAAQLFSQRPEPDYRNSVKESVSSVEAAVQYLLEEKSSGVSKPLRQVVEVLDIHRALADGFEKLYAYTSDDAGIRHGMLEKKEIYQEDARYMLASCAAFSNYLVAKKVKKMAQ
ncbi:AbiJ-NTD4 domain-containing protein [Palleronia salina]|uniref:AbiJ-NTD4 domain-containing protein n=1 Tax=Palleronia salina TaxID=313368 RepID=UPI0015877A54|nr:hypothetical protein [Palleronia salina]